MPDTPFVERRLSLKGGDAVICRFFQPDLIPAEGSLSACYRCTWEITWPSRNSRHSVIGEDGAQALLLAMQNAHWEIEGAPEFVAGDIVDFDPVHGNQGLLALPYPASTPLF